tara:strand:- start:1140 stop:1625 length:486 start_codon:yes stop_codon:yes gene_type:complete
MADNLKAKRILGGQFTADDTLEIQLTTATSVHSCVQHIEVVSGVNVTHGGGAASGTPLHYKSEERDADGDGVIDYSSSEMTIVQVEKGTSVVKVVANIMLLSTHNTFQALYNTWMTDNTTGTGEDLTLNDGSSWDDTPTYPATTELKSGELTLTWGDDSFV